MCSTPLSWASVIGCRGNIRGRAPTRWRLFGKPAVWPLSLGRFWHLLFLSSLLLFFFYISLIHSLFPNLAFYFSLFLFPAFTSMLHLFFFHLVPLLHFLPSRSYTYLCLKTLLLRRKRKQDVHYITYTFAAKLQMQSININRIVEDFFFKGLIDIHWAEIFRRLPEIKWVIHFLYGSSFWSLIVILIMHDKIVWVR